MAIDTATAKFGALTIASMWGAQVYGISMENVIVASIPTFMGALGRVGFDIARAADPNSSVKWSNVAFLFGGTLIATPTVALLGLILLQLTHTTSDPAILFGFVFAGFLGPKSIIWAFNTITGLLNRMFKWQLPTIGPGGQVKNP